jgi:hypothetical protein
VPKKIYLLFYLLASTYIVFIISTSAFFSLSPDGFRFIYLAQKNYDLYSYKGQLYHFLKDANLYDLGRSRHVQYLIFYLDAISRRYIIFPYLNYIMIAFIVLNGYLIGQLLKTQLISKFQNISPILIALLFLTSCFSMSPIILLILYGKIIWVTFVLAFMNSKTPFWKIIFFTLAALSDEFGLFSCMLILYFASLRILINNLHFLKISIPHRLITLPILISLIFLTSYYGINAIVFNTGTSFISIAKNQSIISSTNNFILDVPRNLGWIIQEIFIGHFESPMVTFCIGLITILILFLGFYNKIIAKYFLSVHSKNSSNEKIEVFANDNETHHYLFWLFIFIFINFIGLRGGYLDVTHYGYARAASLMVLFIFSVSTLLKTRSKEIIFISILSCSILVHFYSFSQTVNFTDAQLNTYLFPDKTVNKREVEYIFTSAYAYKKSNKRDEVLIKDTLSLDYSGTWYYSKIENFDRTKHGHFPKNGMYKVLIWPKK